jgi:hypothetical protein
VKDAGLEPAGAPTDGGTGTLSWGQSRSSWGSSLGHDGARRRRAALPDEAEPTLRPRVHI